MGSVCWIDFFVHAFIREWHLIMPAASSRRTLVERRAGAQYGTCWLFGMGEFYHGLLMPRALLPYTKSAQCKIFGRLSGQAWRRNALDPFVSRSVP